MNCLDEGLLQALIDGELAADARREAEAHLASCAACAAAREEAARESAFFSQAFAFDEPLTVPTERLRAGVASAVAEMRPAPSFEVTARRESAGAGARSFWSSLAASLAPRRIAVFASVALVAVALVVGFVALRPGTQTGDGGGSGDIAKGTGAPTPVGGASNASAAPSPAVDATTGPGDQNIAKGVGPKTVRPGLEKKPPKAGPPLMVKNPPGPIRPADKLRGEVAGALPGPKKPLPDLLPVEREYAREIAALSSSIERQKLRTLSPTLRAEYERNVAVVDEAIASTRAAVKSNPSDSDAREFLRAAYQEKLDLLSAVAGKSQLASADR